MQPPQDIESYIHRSGRTARAGKQGKCITLVSGYENGMLHKIERSAGIKFIQEGLPEPRELVMKQIAQLDQQLTPTNDEVLHLFKETATKLILDKGALNAVSLALAHLTGAHEIMEKRSLINGSRDYVTFVLSSNTRVSNFHYVSNILKRVIPFEARIRFENVEFTKNRDVAYFDIPKEKTTQFMDLVAADQEDEAHQYYQIEEAKKIEKGSLMSTNDRRQNQRGGYRNNRGRFNDRDGGNRRFRSQGGNYRGGDRGDGGDRQFDRNRSYNRNDRYNDRDSYQDRGRGNYNNRSNRRDNRNNNRDRDEYDESSYDFKYDY